MGWSFSDDPSFVDEVGTGFGSDEKYLSRDAFINLLYESGLETILGSSVAFLPSQIPEGSKMSIQSIITGIVPINTTWTGDAADGDPQWGFLHPDMDWGFTSRIDFHWSSFQDWIENIEVVDYDGSAVTGKWAVGKVEQRYDDVDADGVPKPPPVWYEIEENGEVWYVAGNAAEMELTAGPFAAGFREFDRLFYTIYLPSLWATSDSGFAWGFTGPTGGEAPAPSGGPPLPSAGGAPYTPDPPPESSWAPASFPTMTPERLEGVVVDPDFGDGPIVSGMEPSAGATYDTGLPEGSTGGSSSTTTVSGMRYSGATAIPWSVWEGYLGYETTGFTGPFSQDSFVAYQQQTELINWFDTFIGEGTMSAHSHLVQRVNVGDPDFTSTGIDMYNVDENLILNYMEVSKVEPLGNSLGVDRLNPKSTSTIDGDYTEISPPVPTDFANVGVATSAYAIDGLKSRYKITSDTAVKMNEWITSKSLEIEATLYTSIATKLFSVKTQKARPLQHTPAFEGIRTPDSTSDTSDGVETLASRTAARTIPAPAAIPTGDY